MTYRNCERVVNFCIGTLLLIALCAVSVGVLIVAMQDGDPP